MPFLEFPEQLRRVVYTTNAVESLNTRFRRAVRHRGHFPNEQAAMKVLYLVATTKRTNRENLTGKTNGWKTILNTLTVHYGESHRRPHPMKTITAAYTKFPSVPTRGAV